MTRFQIALQTAARDGYKFALVGTASWLGAGSNVEYIISKHKSEAAVSRAMHTLEKVRNDVRVVTLEG